jgi:hypothetical protein
MKINLLKPQTSTLVFLASIAMITLLGGCSTIKGWMGADKSD